MLEDEPSELAKKVKFRSGLLPLLNRKLCGKEYRSFSHAVEAALIEEWHLGEAERCTRGEDQKKHGRGREWSWERLLPKWQAKREQVEEQEQGSPGEDSKVQCFKGCWQCGKEVHIAAECLEQRRAAKFLWHVNNNSKREATSGRTFQVKQLTAINSCA